MAETPDSKTPVFVTLGFVVVGVILAILLGGAKGPLIGGCVAAIGMGASAWGMWVGMQQKTQTTLGASIAVFLMALLAAGGLLIWGIVELVK